MPSTSQSGISFPIQSLVTLRYSDVDRQGVVNNAVYGTLFEAGRTDLLYQRLPLQEGTDFVAARLTIDYLAAVEWPGSVEIGTGVCKIGNTSLMIVQALHKDGHRAATCECTLVLLDWATRRPTPLGPALRTVLEALMVPALA